MDKRIFSSFLIALSLLILTACTKKIPHQTVVEPNYVPLTSKLISDYHLSPSTLYNLQYYLFTELAAGNIILKNKGEAINGRLTLIDNSETNKIIFPTEVELKAIGVSDKTIVVSAKKYSNLELTFSLNEINSSTYDDFVYSGFQFEYYQGKKYEFFTYNNQKFYIEKGLINYLMIDLNKLPSNGNQNLDVQPGRKWNE